MRIEVVYQVKSVIDLNQLSENSKQRCHTKVAFQHAYEKPKAIGTEQALLPVPQTYLFEQLESKKQDMAINPKQDLKKFVL